MIEFMDCSEESPATNFIQDCILILLCSGEYGLKLALLIDEAHLLKYFPYDMFFELLQKVFLGNSEFVVRLREEQFDSSVFIAVILY